MVRDPESIEQDIQKAREALAATFDELGTKANPKKLAEDAKANAVAKFEDPRIKYPLIIVAVLIVLLLLRKLLR